MLSLILNEILKLKFFSYQNIMITENANSPQFTSPVLLCGTPWYHRLTYNQYLYIGMPYPFFISHGVLVCIAELLISLFVFFLLFLFNRVL